MATEASSPLRIGATAPFLFIFFAIGTFIIMERKEGGDNNGASSIPLQFMR